MKDVNSIAKRAMEYKEKDLSEKEIADQLLLSPETVCWILSGGMQRGERLDDVVSTGDTIKAAITDVHESGGTAVLAVVLVNKTAHDELAGVPLRALIRARSI